MKIHSTAHYGVFVERLTFAFPSPHRDLLVLCINLFHHHHRQNPSIHPPTWHPRSKSEDLVLAYLSAAVVMVKVEGLFWSRQSFSTSSTDDVGGGFTIIRLTGRHDDDISVYAVVVAEVMPMIMMITGEAGEENEF